MWHTVEKITGPFALIAFLAAVASIILRQMGVHKLKLIEAANPEDRKQLVESALEFFSVDTATLTKEQRYSIAVTQISARARRFTIVFLFASLGVILAAGLAFVAMGRTQVQSGKSDKVLKIWADQNPGLASSLSLNRAVGTSIWYQHFEKGAVYYLAQQGVVFIATSKAGKSRFTKVPKAPVLISHQNEYGEINMNLLDEMIPEDQVPYRSRYLALLNSRELIGGIGTIYVREGLLQTLGKPLHPEALIADAKMVEGDGGYVALVNVLNQPTDPADSDDIRAVILFSPDGSYLRSPVFALTGGSVKDGAN